MERIDPETLQGWLGAPDLFIIDLRNQADWEESHAKIGNAHHFDPPKLSDWSKDLPRDQRLVLY